MSHSLLPAFILFAAAACFTPGPNNIMLMASGLNFGFRRTLPCVAGVALGYAFLVAVVGLGLGAVFEAFPVLQVVLKYVGAAYLVYLAAAIALSRPNVAVTEAGRPITFVKAAMFQWVNVKGWVFAIGTVTAYAAITGYPWNVLLQSAVLLLIGLASAITWLLFGIGLQAIVKSPRAVRIFNVAMALLLLTSLYPVLTS